MQFHEKFPISKKVVSTKKWQEILSETIAHFSKIKWLVRKEEDGFYIVRGGPWEVAVKDGYLFSLENTLDQKKCLTLSEKLLLHRHHQNLNKTLMKFPAEIKEYLIKKLNPNNDHSIRVEITYAESSKKIAAAAAAIRCMTFGKTIRSRQTASLVVWRSIAKKIDYKIFSRTLSLHGYYSTFSEYNILLANKDEVERLSESTPGVVAAWLAIKAKDNIVKTVPKTEDGFNKYVEEIKCESVVAELKEYLAKHNAYSPKNWKYICKLKPRWAKFLFTLVGHYSTGTTHQGEMGDKLEGLLNLLTEIKSIPRLKIYKKFVSFYLSNLSQHPTLPVEDFHIFLQRYFERSYKERVNAFWIQKMHPAIDWWVSLGRDFRLNNTQRKSPWKWFQKKQVEWHEQFGLANDNQTAILSGNYEWDSSITEETIIDKYTIIPLINSDMLSTEGSEMSHCVSGYDYYCCEGKSRIFSIMQKKEKIATLELKKVEADNFVKDSKIKWIVSQVRGFRNASVESKVNKLSIKVATMYTDAFLKNPHGKGKNLGKKKTPDENNVDQLVAAVRDMEVARNRFRELNGLDQYANF